MEHRRKKRFPFFARIYCPEHDAWGHTVNISTEGCHIRIFMPASTGFITSFLLELPIVGILPLKGYVHYLDDGSHGVGLELVQIKFDVEQSDYYSLYQQFVDTLHRFSPIQKRYETLIERGTIKRYEFPEGYSLESLGALVETK